MDPTQFDQTMPGLDVSAYDSYDTYLAEYEMQCEMFDQMVEAYQVYDPSLMSWGEQIAIYDPGYAETILQMEMDGSFGPNAADVWSDLETGADPWLMPPSAALYSDNFTVVFVDPGMDPGMFNEGMSDSGMVTHEATGPSVFDPEPVVSETDPAIPDHVTPEETTPNQVPPDQTPPDQTANAPSTRLEDLSHWNQQDHPYSCAVATTEMILDGYGLDISEAQIAQIFTEAGIYDPQQGTAPTEVDETLNAVFEKEGIPLEAKQVDGWKVEDLEDMLERGVKPLIALDAAETWPGSETNTMNEFLGIPDSGHAVQLIGIDDGPNGKIVILNDPAAPEGQGMQVPMEKFLDACDDFGNMAVAVEKKAA